MKQNITLSIKKELIKKGRILAVKKETSVSKMMGDMLAEMINQDDQYEAAKRNALQILNKGFHMGGGIHWKREDLYDR